MPEQILIEFSADAKELQTVIDLLVKTGQVTDADATKFKALGTQSHQAITAINTPLKQLDENIKSIGVNASKGFVLDSSNSVAKAAKSAQTLTTQFRAARNELAALQQSGTATTGQIAAAAEKAGDLRKQILESNKALAAFNPETRFAVIAQFARGIAGGFAAAQGAMALFGNKSEEVEKALLKVQGALALSQGLNEVFQLADAFKNLKLILTASAAATEEAAIAEGTLAATTVAATTATEGATVATAELNAVLLLNPYVLIAAAVAALVTAIVLWNGSSEESIKITEAEIDAIIKETKTLKDLQREVDKTRLEIEKIKGGKSELEVGLILNKEKFDKSIEDLVTRREKFLRESQAAIDKSIPKETETALTFVGKPGALQEKAVKRETEVSVKARKQAFDALVKPQLEKFAQEESLIAKQLNADNDKARAEAEEERRKKDAKFNEDRKKAQQEFEKELAALQIGIIENETAQKIAALEQAAKEEDAKDQELFAKKLITQEQYAELALARTRKLAVDELKVKQDATVKEIEESGKRAKALSDLNEKAAEQSNKLQIANVESNASDLAAAVELSFIKQNNKSLEAAKKKNNDLFAIDLKALEDKKKLRTDDVAFQQQIDDQIKALKNKNAQENAQSDIDITKATYEGIKEIAVTSLDEISSLTKELGSARIADLEEQRQAVSNNSDEETKKVESDFNRRLISKKTYEQRLKAIEDKKRADTDKLNEREREEKRKQAAIDRDIAIFKATIALYEAVVKATTAGPIVGQILAGVTAAFDLAQIAALIATPLPKFHTGRLAKGNGEELAIVRKDETIFDPRQSKDFHPTFSAIYNRKIQPTILNDFVKERLSEGSFSQNVSASIDTMKLAYDIAYVLRDQNVVVKNAEQLVNGIVKAVSEAKPYSRSGR